MKQGRDLVNLALELERQAKSRRDFISDTRNLTFIPERDRIKLRVEGFGDFEPNSWAHGQIAARTGIHKAYYDRMLHDAPGLLAYNVNHWFQHEPDKQLVRVLDGYTRAFLSEKFRPLENADLAEAVLPVINDVGAKVVSCDVTDRRLYIKAVSEKLEGEVKVGQPVRGGIVASNSEVGGGRLLVEGFFEILTCTNGMIRTAGVRKAHLGKDLANGADLDQAIEYWSQDTHRVTDAALWAQVRDVAKGLFSEVAFERELNKFREAAGLPITGNPVKAVEVLTKRLDLTKAEGESVLQHLIRGADLSQWGLSNAVTRTAQDAADYDRATELERLGGQVIELPQTDWEKVALAA